MTTDSVGREMADNAINTGVKSGLNYAVGFLAGAASGFLDHNKPELAKAFTSAAQELSTVTAEQVRRNEPPDE